MSWLEIQGPVYDVPNEDVDFNPSSVLLNAPGIAIAYLPDDEGRPEQADTLMSVPHHRHDEVRMIINNGRVVHDSVSLDAYLLLHRYLTYPELIDLSETSLVPEQTYLFENESTSFVFRVVVEGEWDIRRNEVRKSKQPDTLILERLLDGAKTVMTRKEIHELMADGDVYSLKAIDKQHRTAYSDADSEPWWLENS